MRISAGSGTRTCLILKLTQRFGTFSTVAGKLVLCQDGMQPARACSQRKTAVTTLRNRVVKKTVIVGVFGNVIPVQRQFFPESFWEVKQVNGN